MTSPQDIQRLLEARVDETLKVHQIPGAAVIAFSDKEIIAAVARGRRSAEDQAPMTLDTLFRMHSVTKMVTAATVLRLRDRDLIDLDAKLSDVAPRLARAAPELLGDLTMAQLLSHTSGLPDGSTEIAEYSRDPADLAEQTRNLAAGMVAIAEKGHVYSYSNYGFSVVGTAIEEVTGKPYAQVVAELVAHPLGLTSLCFDPIIAMTYPLSQQHPMAQGGPVVDHWYGESVRMYPAAMAFMSPNDLARLGRVYLCDGLVPGSSERFLSRQSLEEQQRRHVDMRLTDDRHYGLGMYVGPRIGDADCIGHEGYFTGMWCDLVIYPGQNCGIAWCDNRGDSRELSDARREVIATIYQELGVPAYRHERPITRDVPDEASFVGTYTRTAARPIHVDRDDGGLRLRLGGGTHPLTRHTGNIYRIDVLPELRSVRPFTPHAGCSIPSVAFYSGTYAGASHLSINGLVYGRA